MGQQRWDVVLSALNGPLQQAGPQTLRGPVVRIGANPGPGGLALRGYRGLDARQAVITAYDQATVSVAPVGTAQVRVSPQPHVDFTQLDPITGPTYLNAGGALHLGPPGRGATLHFHKCEQLGTWSTGGVASQAGRPQGTTVPNAAQVDALKVRTIQASNTPVWFAGGALVLVVTSAVCLGALLIPQRLVTKLGPTSEGVNFYPTADLANLEAADDTFRKGVQQGFYDFVMKPNGEAAGQAEHYKAKASWDQPFYDYVLADVLQRIDAWAFFKRLEEVEPQYRQVVLALRQAGLPEVFGAIPYTESRYNAAMDSPACAEGWWQFMPEVAYRLQTQQGLDFQVRDCRLRAKATTWSPSDVGRLAPPPKVYERGEYMYDRRCDITSCAVDDRKDLTKSTTAAMTTLREAWDDPQLRASGALVQLVITSHNAGYNDRPYGVGKASNVLPAYRRYVRSTGQDPAPHFLGAMVRCDGVEFGTDDWCDSYFPPEAQHYAYRTIATHILAACYYGANYGDVDAWRPYAVYNQTGGYCQNFNVPTATQVRQRRSQR